MNKVLTASECLLKCTHLTEGETI